MPMELIKTTQQEGLATITLNRPDRRNAMNGVMVSELSEALSSMTSNKDVRVILIKGEGNHFCAGADIGWMQTVVEGDDQAANESDAKALADLMYQLYQCRVPTIVLAHGATMGGGLGLVSACDIALAADDARFAFSEVKIGIAPAVISPYAVAAMGERLARYYFLTGDVIEADEALDMGLVHRVVAAEDLEEAGIALAEAIMKNGREALTAAKQIIRDVTNQPITPALVASTALRLANLRKSPEGKEGLRAFIEKRQPVWEK